MQKRRRGTSLDHYLTDAVFIHRIGNQLIRFPFVNLSLEASGIEFQYNVVRQVCR